MLWYEFASDSPAERLLHAFADEIENPGCRGHSTLLFRFLNGEGAQEHLSQLEARFVQRFGALPLFLQV